MFFLLYKRTDIDLDDFPKISDHFPKISEDFPKLSQRPDERSRTFSENFRKFPKMSEDCRRLPKTFDEDPKMFWWFKYKTNLTSLKSSISSHVKISYLHMWGYRIVFVWLTRSTVYSHTMVSPDLFIYLFLYFFVCESRASVTWSSVVVLVVSLGSSNFF